MLRISRVEEESRKRLKLEGKLANEWVAEAESAWATVREEVEGGEVLVDLCGVSFVDDRGRELLTQMHLDGAKLMGSGPMIGGLIEDIVACDQETPIGGRWTGNILGVLLFLVLATMGLR